VAAYFFDTSALVKRYAREMGTAWVLSLFRRVAGHRLYATRITGVEAAAALTRKRRGRTSLRTRRHEHSRICAAILSNGSASSKSRPRY
jgi:predicted nucleic acid-binding protein